MEGRRNTELLKSDSRERIDTANRESGTRVAFKPITEESPPRRTRDIDSELRKSKSRERQEFTENVDRMNQNIGK